MIIFDLDGTLRIPASGEEFISNPKDQIIINYHLLRKHKEDLCVGYTNQGGVISGFKTFKECVEEQVYFMKLAPQIERVYFCPDWGDSLVEVWQDGFNVSHIGIGFRKPQPNGIRLIQQIWGRNAALFYGNEESDRLAAEAVGVEFVQC